VLGDDRPSPSNLFGAGAGRVWRCTHFSWFMTSMLHRLRCDFDAELQLSQLRRIATSEAAARELAENYTGLPLER
jgi:p-hydroxybenzoate 3-monooxygenase